MRWNRLLAAATAGWVLLLFAAPSNALGIPLSAVAYACGAAICHQRPERSFHLGAAQFPVCARCMGLYVGAAVGVMIWRLSRTRRWSWRSARLMACSAAMPTAAVWMFEFAGLGHTSNELRAIAAVPLGIVIAATLSAGNRRSTTVD